MPRAKTSGGVYREPLNRILAEPLLGSEYTVLQQAREQLANAVSASREKLRSNPLTPIVARDAAKGVGKRGEVLLEVDADGQLYLVVQPYKLGAGPNKRPWNSNLPDLAELRARASALGLNVEGEGRARRRILLLIEEAERKTNSRPRMTKTAPALSLQILNPEKLPPG